MTSRERVLAAVSFREADRVPIDLGGTRASGISAVIYDRLKRRMGIATPTKIHDPMQIQAEIEPEVLEELKKHFRPEFLNRIDETLIFDRLTEKHMERIVDIQMENVRRRLAERKISLALTEKARAHLVKESYDPDYGARPLKRFLQREITDPLARKILAGEFHDGDRVEADLDKKGEVAFRKTGTAAVQESV